jgi:virulence-associated protein VapD
MLTVLGALFSWVQGSVSFSRASEEGTSLALRTTLPSFKGISWSSTSIYHLKAKSTSSKSDIFTFMIIPNPSRVNLFYDEITKRKKVFFRVRIT